MKIFIALFLSFLLMTGCTLSPPYCRPQGDVPNTWRIPVQASPCEEELCWWQGFNDPELDALICTALRNNQDIKVAIYRVEAFLARLQITNSRLYPQIEGQVTAEREKSSTGASATPGMSGIDNIFTAVLNASYFVDIWGRIRSASDAALAEVYSEIETRRAVVLGVITSVASSYIRLREFDKQLMISKLTLESRNESLYLAKVRYELGLTSEMQVEQALAQVQDAETSIKQFEILIALEEDLLSFLIGEPSGPIKRGKTLNEITLPPKVPGYLPSQILNQRPDILAAEQQLIAANARIGVARSLFFPQITLTGALGIESLELGNFLKSTSSIWQYGISMLQEIFTGGRLTGQLNLAKAEKQELVHQYQSTILNAFKEVNDALISHQITLELIEVQKEKVETLKEYLRLSRLRYNEGETDYLTVLDAERRYFSAELDLAQSQADGFTTYINIYQAVGGGWVVNADAISEESECCQDNSY